MKIKLLALIILAALSGAFFARHSITGSLNAQDYSNFSLSIKDDLSDWSDASKKAVKIMRLKYGEPDEISSSMMVWNNIGPWKKTIIYSKSIHHNFPEPHSDVIQQFINYKVPADKYEDLMQFNGSIEFSRTKGELSARCNKEEVNILTLNLAHEIISEKIDAKLAREIYINAIGEINKGGSPDYTKQLIFNVQNHTTDPDMPGYYFTANK